MRRITGLLGLALAGAMIVAPGAQARDDIVESFDGEPIIVHFFPAPGLEPGERAPTIMSGHGWGGSGATSPPQDFAAAGYNVLTWDARGFGGSGGTVMIDHPEFEGRDVQVLIDYVADQPEAQLDGSGDPRVGMDGPSYGGGIQLVAAGLDDRIDAITPTIAWNTLPSSLYKTESVKAGWGLALAGLGIPTSTLPGVFSPAGVQTGNQSPEFFDLVTTGTTTGRFSDPSVDWLDEHGPDFLLDEIEAPTLIVQGTVDTLFTLEEAHRNHEALKDNGVPLKMLWFCGGHGACFTESDSGDVVGGIAGNTGLAQERKLAWFDRWLREDTTVATGAAFEWIDEQGTWHSSDAYPLADAGSVSGSGSGVLTLTPGASGSGILIFATPSTPNVTIPIEIPPAGSHVVGEPRLDLTYTATGASTAPDGNAHVFAQLVDKQRNIVVNNFATPIPIELDGQQHDLSIDLERIASRSTASGYELQIIPQTNVYDFQRATGLLEIDNAEIELPLAEPISKRCPNEILGTRGKDRLRGTEGGDSITGRGKRDRLSGRPGRDCVKGGAGRDRLRGGKGRDVIRAAGGGADRINCGAGKDVAVVKPSNDSWRRCERVRER